MNYTVVFTNLSIPSVIFADASWYGSLRGGVEFGGGTDGQFKDGGSRWGIKGSNELSEGLSAVYRFEHKISTTNAGQAAGRLAYVGLSGGFGTVSLGQIWNAAFNHVGGITDPSWHYGNAHMDYRHGSALSYAVSAGSVSLQLDAVMDNATNTGDAVDKIEFGMTFGLGDIGKVGLAYVDKKDQNIMTASHITIPDSSVGGSAPTYSLGGSAPEYELERGEPIPMPATVSDGEGEEFNLMIDDDGNVKVSSSTRWHDGSEDKNSVTASDVNWELSDAGKIVNANAVTEKRKLGTAIVQILSAELDADDFELTTAYLAGATFDEQGRQTSGATSCAAEGAECRGVAVFSIDNTAANTLTPVRDSNGNIIGHTGSRTIVYYAPTDADNVDVTAEYDTPGEITGVTQKAGTGYTGVTQDEGTGYSDSGTGEYSGTYRKDAKGAYVMTHEKDGDKWVAKYIAPSPTHVMNAEGKFVAPTGTQKATHTRVVGADGKEAYTSQMYSRTYMTKSTPDVEKGHRASYLAAQFNLGAVSAHLGYMQKQVNGATDKTKVTHYGVGGDIGDTGMSFMVQARSEDNADGTKTNPWFLTLGKSLGDGASAYFEHGNADDGESGKTTMGLKVDF